MTLAPTVPAPARPIIEARTVSRGFVLAGILLVALNLRAAITGLGALLPEVTNGLHLSGTVAGLITTLPALSFAAFGAFTPHLTRRFSSTQILLGSMVVLAIGQGARVVTDSSLVFLISTALAMSGIAVANVLLPALVREHFPHRAGLVTGIYTMTLIAGSAAAAAASVPIAHALGSWRAGLGVWALLAAVAALPWIGRALPGTRQRKSDLRVGRTRLGWGMALYFGAQSLSGYATMGWLAQIFRDASFSPANAGLLLAGVTTFGLPIALLMPTLAGRRKDLRPLVLGLSTAMILAYLGLAFSPHTGALLWVALLGIGQGAFPLALAMIGMRARTRDGIVALSAFAQSTGYVIAALGPLVVGMLHDLTGAWQIPIGFLVAAAIVQVFAGLAVARPRFVEDGVSG
ncbi:MFS transporter [Rhizocola hellebori]|uniref:MFS transporter n=1 Tax=Rhizocola hellebori TaxID=1392758 RepID=A0A8J3VFS8_9ACTN|nr:MFS transporter [Rhizocola hellebori]